MKSYPLMFQPSIRRHRLQYPLKPGSSLAIAVICSRSVHGNGTLAFTSKLFRFG